MLIPLSLRVQCQTLSVDWSQLYAVVYKMRIFLCNYCAANPTAACFCANYSALLPAVTLLFFV